MEDVQLTRDLPGHVRFDFESENPNDVGLCIRVVVRVSQSARSEAPHGQGLLLFRFNLGVPAAADLCGLLLQ